MNKKTFIFLLLVLYSFIVDAQSFPSNENSPTWEFKTPVATMFRSEKLWVDVDTILEDGISWFQVWSALEYNPDFRNEIDTSIIGWYRVDGERVVYKDIFGLEGTLYDFSLVLGEEALILPPSNVALEPIMYKVVATDTVFCNGVLRKRMDLVYNAFNSTFGATWIEGLGNIYYPFLPASCRENNCEIFYESGVFTTTSDSIALSRNLSCGYTTALFDRYNEDLFLLSPNPVRNFEPLRLEVKSSSFRKDRPFVVYVYNASLKLVHTETRMTFNEDVDLSLSKLSSGLHTVVLVDAQGTVLRKRFIISK